MSDGSLVRLSWRLLRRSSCFDHRHNCGFQRRRDFCPIIHDRQQVCINCCAYCCALFRIRLNPWDFATSFVTHNPFVAGSSPARPIFVRRLFTGESRFLASRLSRRFRDWHPNRHPFRGVCRRQPKYQPPAAALLECHSQRSRRAGPKRRCRFDPNRQRQRVPYPLRLERRHKEPWRPRSSVLVECCSLFARQATLHLEMRRRTSSCKARRKRTSRQSTSTATSIAVDSTTT